MNIVRDLKRKYKKWKYNLLYNLVWKFYGKLIDERNINGDSKEKFEKSVLDLLREYKIIDSKHCIQDIKIHLNCNEYPDIKIRTLIINQLEEEVNYNGNKSNNKSK